MTQYARTHLYGFCVFNNHEKIPSTIKVLVPRF